MTLDEAIKHAEEVAEEQEKISLYTPIEMLNSDDDVEKCQECANEHRQLAAWLRELKRLKEKDEPKMVRYEGDRLAFCPRCNWTFEYLYESWEREFHCPNCGQKLRWEE